MIELEPVERLQIAPDLHVGDLKTLDEHDAAIAFLAREIASIEAKLAEEDDAVSGGASTADADLDWRRRAVAASKVKKAIKQIVINRRGDLTRAAKLAAAQSRDRTLLAILNRKAPDLYQAAVAELDGVAA